LNAWKHHAGAIREHIAIAVRTGHSCLDELSRKVAVIGSDVMDLYLGELAPARIGEEIVTQLESEGCVKPEAYRKRLESNGGYQTIVLSDGSRWILRLGDQARRYVHVHPARRAPGTLRVRANVLKTAILTLAVAGVRGADPLDVAVINRTRAEFLGCSPISSSNEGPAIRRIIDLLRPR
jgi:hypothetical protein